MARTVRFDPISGVALVPPLTFPGNTPPVHAIASHLSRKVRKLRPGKWFIQMAHGDTCGYIGFHDNDDKIQFTIEESAR